MMEKEVNEANAVIKEETRPLKRFERPLQPKAIGIILRGSQFG